jgi:hypothetical protein
MYKRVRLDIIGSEIRVDLLPLELCDFDVILGTDWLSTYRAQMNYFAKPMILQGDSMVGVRVV